MNGTDVSCEYVHKISSEHVKDLKHNLEEISRDCVESWKTLSKSVFDMEERLKKFFIVLYVSKNRIETNKKTSTQ